MNTSRTKPRTRLTSVRDPITHAERASDPRVDKEELIGLKCASFQKGRYFGEPQKFHQKDPGR